VTSPALAEPPSVSARSGALGLFGRDCMAVAQVEVYKVLRNPTELFTRALQPALWLVIFGVVFTRARAIPTGSISYLEFMAPGVLAQSVLFSGIFYGIAVIWERDLGIVHKLLVSPAPRSALVLGKAIAAGLRALSQAIIVVVLALLLGVHVRLDAIGLTGVAVGVMLGAALFSTFSFTVACLVKTRERFMGIGQVLTMPLFFASNAIYPLSLMPGWLRIIARLNPLSYLVDALRVFMVHGAVASSGLLVDFAVLTLAFGLLIGVGARLFPVIVH
jgi:ABC-2 type transport system permease protein